MRENLVMEIVGALLAGAVIGSVLGYIGAGGAMLALPILIYIFQFSPHNAITASLAIVGLSATSGAIAKARNKEILYREALTIWAIGLLTNISFSSISDSLPDRFITIGFSLVLLVAGISMIANPLERIHSKIPTSILILISLSIGAITGLFGIGGGFLAIPILVLFFGTPISTASGTSLLIIALNSLTSLLVRSPSWADVQWKVPVAMALVSILVAQIASHRGSTAAPALLKRLFALLLIAISLFTFVEALLQS